VTSVSESEAAMTDQEHFRKLERSYQSAACNQYYAPVLNVLHGASELTIAIEDKFFHTGGAVHGSVYFKALDDAAFFAVNSLVRDVAVLTISFTIHFLRPVSDGRLHARGTVVHASERLFFAESRLTDLQNRVLATGMGTFAKSRMPLSAQIGYE
jgi:uncharacterized protein (TIGR00369 family)